MRPFEEKLGRRFMVTCRSLNLMLQGCISESETGPLTNVRGTFLTPLCSRKVEEFTD